VNHLKQLFYLLAMLAGSASLAHTFLIWLRYRKAVIRRYGWFLLSLFLLLLGFIFCAPPFYHSLLGLPFTGWVRAAFFLLDALAAAAALADLLFPALRFTGVAQPVYFLALNVLTILFGLRYLNRPAYADQDRLTEHFVSAFKVTEREQEIIRLLIEGTAGKAIGERLFISPKTVEDHVYNIYQKLGVKNRVQLFRLIRANALE
jgi:DNA-binding CsgD family transcriptional regulator